MFYGLTYCLVRSILEKVRKGLKTTAKGGLVQRLAKRISRVYFP